MFHWELTTNPDGTVIWHKKTRPAASDTAQTAKTRPAASDTAQTAKPKPTRSRVKTS